MTDELSNEEAIKAIYEIKRKTDMFDDLYLALDMAIKALEQQPCEDCISREALIEKATSWDKHFADSERCVSLTEIQNAPSVTPQSKIDEIIKRIEQTRDKDNSQRKKVIE